MNLFIIFLLVIASSQLRNLQYLNQVIIIGSGASAIGASVSLTARNVQHIFLQARNRSGGRINQGTSNGVAVDLGASFVHNPGSNNAIDNIVNQINWPKIPANFSAASLFYQSTSLSDTDFTTASTLYKNLLKYIDQTVTASGDTDLLTLWNAYYATISSSYSTAILNQVYYQLYLEASLNGAELNNISGLAFSSNSENSSSDYLPAGGYPALFAKIYQLFCGNAPIYYNQVVSTIDYSGPIVKITTTSNQVYYANKVISSLPLGVLQANSVTFTPSLPTAYQSALTGIGFGTFNKIIVTLNTTFWPSGTSILDFVANSGQPFTTPEAFVMPSPNNNMVVFFMSGTTSQTLDTQTDAAIIANITSTLQSFSLDTSVSILNYVITRWEQDPYALGSYSYYKVGTTINNFLTLNQPIQNKVWIIGEHTHPTMSSNVHGAFQTGLWAGQGAASASELLLLLSVLAQLLFLVFAS